MNTWSPKATMMVISLIGAGFAALFWIFPAAAVAVGGAATFVAAITELWIRVRAGHGRGDAGEDAVARR